MSRSGSTYILDGLAYGIISLTLLSILSITDSIASVSKLSTNATSIAIKTSSGARCIERIEIILFTSGILDTIALIILYSLLDIDSPISNSLFSLAKNTAKAINSKPIISEPIASKILSLVISVKNNATAATIIPKSAAVSSTITVNTDVSLLSLNSATNVESFNLSSLSSIVFLKE